MVIYQQKMKSSSVLLSTDLYLFCIYIQIYLKVGEKQAKVKNKLLVHTFLVLIFELTII